MQKKDSSHILTHNSIKLLPRSTTICFLTVRDRQIPLTWDEGLSAYRWIVWLKFPFFHMFISNGVYLSRSKKYSMDTPAHSD